MGRVFSRPSPLCTLTFVSVLMIAVIAVVIAGLNYYAVQNLLEKGNMYNKVEIENQLVPEKDENGNWYFTTDGDFKVIGNKYEVGYSFT